MNYTGQVIIDGNIFRYTLTPEKEQEDIPGEAPVIAPALPPPAPPPVTTTFAPPPAAIPPAQMTDGAVYTVALLNHEMKSGLSKKGGKPWEMHNFRGSDNRKYQTFKNEIAGALGKLVGTGQPVKIVGRENDYKGIDIVRIVQ